MRHKRKARTESPWPEPKPAPRRRQRRAPGVPGSDEEPPLFASSAEGDHAETPLVAYEHLAYGLERLAASLSCPPATLRIYDPFYCKGTCIGRLSSLGFNTVRNEPVDFWAVTESATGPAPFDVLVTNPPFSGDNIARLLAFVARRPEPFCLLLPEFVAQRACYRQLQSQCAAADRPLLFLGPKAAPYDFEGVVGAAADSSSSGGRVVAAGSFQCVWFVGGLDRRMLAPRTHPADFAVAAAIGDLPRLAPATKLTPAERRWRKKQRLAGGDGTASERA